MNIFRINTTPYKEEDFYLHTELTVEEIVEVITPIVEFEREGENNYDNELLLDALKKKYSRKKVELYIDFDLITI